MHVYEHEFAIQIGVVEVLEASIYPTLQVHGFGLMLWLRNWLLSHDVQLLAELSRSQVRQVAWHDD